MESDNQRHSCVNTHQHSVDAAHRPNSFRKSNTRICTIQKTLRSQSKKPAEPADKGKKGGKGAKGEAEESCWVQSGDIPISFTEQGQTEILFEAIEKINLKIQEIEKFKVTVQQLARLGLGTTVNYIVYIEEDIPKKIVLKPKANAKGDEAFKFATELSVPAYYNESP